MIRHPINSKDTFHHPLEDQQPDPGLKPAEPIEKMELCNSRAGIRRNWRYKAGHAELVRGNSRQERRNHDLVFITNYRCNRCGTTWDHKKKQGRAARGLINSGPVDGANCLASPYNFARVPMTEPLL